jgi:hypothetical protein
VSDVEMKERNGDIARHYMADFDVDESDFDGLP